MSTPAAVQSPDRTERHPAYAGMRIGADIPMELDIHGEADFVVWAEENGFDDVWIAEISDPDAFVALAAAAARTERIRLGTAIVQLGTRTVPLLAASGASLAEYSRGRFALGVGASTKAIIDGWHGLPYDRPRERMSEALPLLRSIMAGERSKFEGRQLRSKGFQLRHPPADPPPIILAAMNKRMLELAGELADGVFLNCVPVDALPRVIETVNRGVERSGREDPVELLYAVPCEVTDDVEAARARWADGFAFYLTAPPYRSALSWYGLEEEVAIAEKAWEARDFQKVRQSVSARLIDELTVFGTAEQCRKRIAAYGAAGVTTVSITPNSVDPRDTLRALAPYTS
jgi:probable F420-dependent oxidoreductase